MSLVIIFDIVMAAGLLWLCWSALASENLFKGTILFIVYGFFMAIAWARLNAPDIALAEAAIGAGLTGALVLDAVGQMHKRSRAHHEA